MSHEELTPDQVMRLNDAGLVLRDAFTGKSLDLVHKAIRILEDITALKEEVVIIEPENYNEEEQEPFIPSACPWLAPALCGGVRAEELILVGGAPFAGKTHLLRYLSGNYAIAGFSVLDFNGEDLKGDIVKLYRDVCPESLTKIHIADVVEQKFTTNLVERVMKQQTEKGFSPDVVVIDHIDIMHSSFGREDWLGASDNVKGLRMLAKKYSCIMLVGTQLNNDGTLFRSKVGKMMHADIGLFITGRRANELNVFIEKGRGRKLEDRRLYLEYDDHMRIDLIRTERY